MSKSSQLSDILRIQDFNLYPGEASLKDRLNPSSDHNSSTNAVNKLRRIKKGLEVLFGNCDYPSSIPEAADKLLKRNYPELCEIHELQNLQIFIAEYFLSKAFNLADPSRGSKLLSHVKSARELYLDRNNFFDQKGQIIQGAKKNYEWEEPEREIPI